MTATFTVESEPFDAAGRDAGGLRILGGGRGSRSLSHTILEIADTRSVRTLAARLFALEARVVPATPALCAVCGDPVDLSLPAIVKRDCTVCFEGDADGTPDLCPGCGRRQVYHITFDKGG